MFRHARFDGRDRADGSLRDLRAVAAVDAGNRQVQQDVEYARRSAVAEQPVEQFAGLGADAGQGAGLGEEGIEKRGPHVPCLPGAAAGGKVRGGTRTRRHVLPLLPAGA